MLRVAGVAKTKARAMRQLELALKNRTALAKMREVVAAQGGDARMVDEPDRLPLSKHRKVVLARDDGFITDMDPLEIGHASMRLGAGRARAEDGVDPGAGVRLHCRLGDEVREGDILATLYASRRALIEASIDRVASSFRIGARRPPRRGRIVEIIRR